MRPHRRGRRGRHRRRGPRGTVSSRSSAIGVFFFSVGGKELGERKAGGVRRRARGVPEVVEMDELCSECAVGGPDSGIRREEAGLPRGVDGPPPHERVPLGPHLGAERHKERLRHEGVALERRRGRGGQRRKCTAEGSRELACAGDDDGLPGET